MTAKKIWAGGRVKGTHSVRLDSDIFEMAKHGAEKKRLSIKDFVSMCILKSPDSNATKLFNKEK